MLKSIYHSTYLVVVSNSGDEIPQRNEVNFIWLWLDECLVKSDDIGVYLDGRTECCCCTR